MKKFVFNLLAVSLVIAFNSSPSKAQVSVGVHVGIWTPPPAYASVNYYYLPDVESYYYVPTHQYVYLNGGNWVFRASLPSRYSDYDINSGYKVAINRPRPYRYFYHDRDAYRGHRGERGGTIFRDHYRSGGGNYNHYGNRPHGNLRGYGNNGRHTGQMYRGGHGGGGHGGGGRPGGGEHGGGRGGGGHGGGHGH
ncbi:hypothetical protein [Mucilaginibacter xinganensis]|uniref:Uncharacterized protein n=1 Tax=Mucilaginibacter xinganensis TaxID=1234841 RepID=A0A223NWY6_9SPHI|nr:hypothetical protein [Mucilaginibacter xinganensis]ASU34300.1 hypothetical protein MuYL_2413 [Mucilaginibacter xinganensis]